MGGEQSKAAGQAQAAPAKTCYYELLSIDIRATDEEIRRAYKKKALELHPDRNFNDVENATRKFAEVQTAYEVLSDPQERAWYDSHRDAILRGDDGVGDADGPGEHYNVKITTAEEIFTLMGRFNSRVAFSDAPTGFFGILGETFDQLAAEERAAADWEGHEMLDYPSFGSSTETDAKFIKAFYAFWSGFSTCKSFSWKDKYRASDAPDRYVRRMIEKENKQFRREAIREFNDAVRSLVAFVKKRDPRFVVNAQAEADRQKFLRESAAAQAARSRAANQEKMASYSLPDWAKARPERDAHQGEISESDDDVEYEVIECVVCNKSFKSEKQFEAHEKSKKHLKAVQQLKREMRKDNIVIEEDTPPETPAADPTPSKDQSDVEEVDGVDSQSASSVDEPTSSPPATRDTASGSASEDGDYASRAEVEDRLSKATAGLEVTDEADASEPPPPPAQSNKTKQPKARRAKKVAKDEKPSTQCSVCNEVFTSRTKLFDHIKENGHAAPIASKNQPKKRNK